MIWNLVDIFQNQYPERLRKCYVINANAMFWATWRIIEPFVAQRTRNKVVWEPEADDLLEEIAPETLMEAYGGDRSEDFPIPGVEELEEAEAKEENRSAKGKKGGVQGKEVEAGDETFHEVAEEAQGA